MNREYWTTTMENQVEKNMEHHMEARVTELRGAYLVILRVLSSRFRWTRNGE